MKSRLIVAVVVMTILSTAAIASGLAPELRLSDNKGQSAIARIDSPDYIVSSDPGQTLNLHNWNDSSANKKLIAKELPVVQFQSADWEGSVYDPSGAPIILSWGVYDSPDSIDWKLAIKPINESIFQDVDISTPGSMTLWQNGSYNSWAFYIQAINLAPPVPEPTSLVALGTGLASIYGVIRRRKR